jgi:hypothetical protein
MKSKVLLKRVGFGCLLFTGLALASPSAQAGKPGGGGTTPAYKYINLGTWGQSGGTAMAINASGVVVGRLPDAAGSRNSCSAFVVVPKDTNHDGQPDVWFEDLNHDGLNDLQIALGRPPGLEDVSDIYVIPSDINDLGQILIVASGFDLARGGEWDQSFVLTPRDLNGDGQLEYGGGDPGAANSLMEPLCLDGILDLVSVSSINNLGQIVGEGYLPGDSPGSSAPLGFVLVGQDTDADGVADTWFEDSGGGVNGLVRTLGYAQDQYGELTTVTAAKINDRGEIAGRIPRWDGEWGNACLIRPLITEAGQTWCVDENADGLNDLVVKLLPVDRKAWGETIAINAAGKLTGWATLNASKTDLLLLWQVDAAGTMITTTKLPQVGGEGWHRAMAINGSDVVVGYAITYGPAVSVRDEGAFVFQNGTTKDLRTLTDQTSALQNAWMGASDVNDAGQIVGWTQSATLGDHPFIAVPVKK